MSFKRVIHYCYKTNFQDVYLERASFAISFLPLIECDVEFIFIDEISFNLNKSYNYNCIFKNKNKVELVNIKSKNLSLICAI